MDNKPVEAFTQAMEPVYKNLLLLLTIFILLAFGVYVSYILNENTNRPVYLSENSFDLFLNNSNLNSVTSSTTINGVTVNQFNKLGVYQDIDFCPQGQCSVNLSTGVKICPSTVTNNSSNSTNQISVTYDKTIEVCVDSQKCPPQLPYAIRADGSALNENCDQGSNCYCTANPQCATQVVKYFQNEGGNPGSAVESELNYSFATVGDKVDNNLLNNLIIDIDGSNYCQLNPAYTDKIVDGCNFANKWNDPTGCQYTNIFNKVQQNSGIKFKVANYSETIAKFKNLAGLDFSTNNNYSKGLNFIGVISSSDVGENISNDNINLGGINQSGSITINKDSYIYQDSEIIGNFILLNKLGVYNNGNFRPGLVADINSGVSVVFNNGYLSNCQDPSNDNVNFKNMLTCLQPYNQPCTDGILTYNTLNPTTFCQGSGTSLSLNNIDNFFLVNPAYFTVSCIVGAGCDDSIDTDLCAASDDCQFAFKNKLEKLFPQKDYSALTNLFIVEPSNFGLSFRPSITAISNGTYSITNNFIPLENGDYWEIKNNVNGVFLTTNGIVNSNIINVNNTTRLKTGMSINFSSDFTIENIIGTSVYLSGNLNSFDTTIAQAGLEIVTYSNKNYFGTVSNISSFVNKQTFQLFELNNETFVTGDKIDIKNNYITFYKQFGYNGLNYNTIFNMKTFIREFSSTYYYKAQNPHLPLKPPFTVFELLQSSTDANVKFNGLINETANFKQKYSMFYPVFNEQYFRQECVYCSPSLSAFTYIDDNNGNSLSGGVSGINIQFSGQDYYHYGYGNINNKFQFNQISFGLTADSKERLSNLSNCGTIVLSSPVSGIEVGDYVIDQTGYLYKDMVANVTGESISGSFYLYPFGFDLISLPDDKYLPFKLNGTTFSPEIDFDLDASRSSFAKNVFYGKAYFNANDSTLLNEYYIRPVIRIVKISSDKRTIYTDSPSIHPIPEKTIIQFISVKNNLSVDIIQDPQDTFQATGAGATLEIESITQGRIVSLLVTNPGQGYSTLNRPLVYIDKYAPDTSLLNISS